MIIKDTLYYGLAKVFSIIISLFTIKLLSTNLSIEKFGEVDLYLISISLVSIIIGFGINSAVNRELNLFQRKVEDVIASSIVFFIKSILIVVIAYFINLHFGLIDDSQLVVLVLFSALVFTINEVFVGLMRSLSKSKLYFYTSVLQSITYLVMIYFYTEELSVKNVLLAYLVSYVFILIVSIYYFRNNLIGKFDKEIYKSLAYYGIPLIFSGLAGFIFNVSDKYMLGYYRTLEEVGIYAMAYKVSSLVMIVIGVVQMAWPKYMYKIYKEENNYEFIYNFVAKYYLYSLVMIGLFVILFADFFILLFSNSDYLEGVSVIPIVVFGMILLGFQNISNQGIHITGKSHIMTSIIILGGVVNIGLNYLFIPQYGYMAAAWTTFISMFVMQVVTLYFSTKLLKINYSYIKLLFTYILFVLVSIFSLEFTLYIKVLVFVVSSLLFYLLLYTKEDIHFIRKRIKK